MELVITSRVEAGHTVVTVVGEIDTYLAPHLLAVLDGRVDAGERKFVVDLSEVMFCGSTGLTVLVVSHKRVALDDGWLRVAAPTNLVRKAMELTAVHKVIGIYPDVASALVAD